MKMAGVAGASKGRQAEVTKTSPERVKIFLERARQKGKAWAASAGPLKGRIRSFFGNLRMRATAIPGALGQRGQGFARSLKGGLQGTLRRRAAGKSRKMMAAAGIALVLAISGFLGTYIYNQGFGFVLVVEGQEIGFVTEEDSGVIEHFLAELSEAAAIHYDAQVARNERVEFLRERRPGEHMVVAEVQDELQQILSFSVYGYSLSINGVETAVLASEEDYSELINRIKDAFVDDNGDAVLRHFAIQDDFQLAKTLVPPDAVARVEEVADLLLNKTAQRRTYLVSRGDSLYTIARNQNMSLEELQQANPQVTGHLIRPGDELNLVKAMPMVTVSMVEEVTVLEKIPHETRYVNDSSMYTNETRITQAGSHGEKEVTYQVTKENGMEVSRRVLQEEVITEPLTQVVVRGTRRRPFDPTGRFGWPLPAGTGTLTSPYGWRGGSMHYGIDIAAPTGTAIRAAESGVVTTSAYRGSYGNLVIINHSSGYSTYYAHNSRNLVSVGQRVSKGQTIALVGSTGNSTGPHVHFEIRRNGSPVNPMNFYRR